MRIELPWPDARLNPNRSKGTHWSVTANLRKEARERAFWIAREALVRNRHEGGGPYAGGQSVALRITFVAPNKVARDLDNLLAALKPGLDGVADCLGTDDSKFEPITIHRAYGKAPGAVIVEVGDAVEEQA